MSDLHIGLAGCGNWGQYILRDLLSLGCDVTVVARSEQSQARAKAVGATRLVGDVTELPDIQGLVIATPTTTHYELFNQVVDRNIPVFTEKPLTADVAQAEDIVQRAGERIFVMDKWRYHRGVEKLAEIARSAELGKVVGLRLIRHGWKKRFRDVDVAWYLAPHDLSITLEILGDIPEPRTATASFTNGKATEMLALLGEDPWVVIDVSEQREVNFRETRLLCEHGTAILPDSYSDHIAILPPGDSPSSEPPVMEKRPIASDMPLLLELQAFVEHCRGGPPPRSNARDSLLIVQRIHQLRQLAGIRD
jgi:predicted dehydrogenase